MNDATPAGPAEGRGRRHERLARLRRELRRRRLAGFVVPRADQHQGEYVPAAAERLRWLTGFSGSAGVAVVLAAEAALFVDGRYTVQAREEVAAGDFVIRHSLAEPMATWIAERLPRRGRLGYDPWLHTPAQVTALEAACVAAGGRAMPVADNPVDRLWSDRPAEPTAPFVVHPQVFAGVASADKRAQIAAALAASGEAAAVLAQPDAIAWLLNIRGGDVPFAPLPLAFAIVHGDGGVDLFCDERKVSDAVRAHVGDDVRIAPPAAMPARLAALAAAGTRVRIDPDGTPAAIARQLERGGAILSPGADPTALPKATKNAVELAGIRAAHRRDGAALCRFLAWLETTGPGARPTEIEAAARLDACREAGDHYRGPSFPTISAAAGNGAVVHYRATERSDQRLVDGSLYLVDSGGQYLDGTTDVTRTIAIGAPTAEMRARFTQVLQGHIALAAVVFPKGTTGSQLDSIARLPLWRAGGDYDHGTGHGVGAYLGVHEGPQRISKLPNRVALAPGMVLSNEPGFYREGAFGIRIENLVVVTERRAPEGSELELYGFDTLTLAPIDRRLIVADALSATERAWLDAYHAAVRESLAALLGAAEAAWLAAATAPLAGC